MAERRPAVAAQDVDIRYRVFEDQRPTLRRAMAKGFRSRRYREVHAVRDVSFIAYTGQAIGVVGPNGSGKSTLLRAVAGLQPTSGGRVLARSTPVLLGVRAALQAELSGRRNIWLGATALGLSRRDIAERLDDIVAFAGLEDFIELPLRTYSSGMRARLQFSIATAVAPEILLIDEALAVGDAEFRERSAGRIRELVDGAGTVFLVSHNLKAVRKMCSRVLWLHQGRLRADGPSDEVIDAYKEQVERGSAR